MARPGADPPDGLAHPDRPPHTRPAGCGRGLPHGLVQEFLNRSDSHLWGIVSNGKTLRLLRDNASLTRQAYVEFDLAAIFDGESFADFTLLWLCCYRTRFEGDIPQRCLLEQWSKEAASASTRAREKLRSGVEQAIVCLGNGVLAHPDNAALRSRLRSDDLIADDLQRQLLRIVYRMLFLLVAESRNLLLDPDAPHAATDRYRRFYSMDRLRRLANKRRGGTHSDLWQGMHATMAALDVGDDQPQAAARDALGLTSLGSQLWSQQAIPDLADAHIDNAHLLEAVRNLAFVRDDEAKRLRTVDYQNLGTEELGSVYESLLELHAIADPEDRTFSLDSAAGSERKTTGSYYTPPELIARLLDNALDPVIEEAKAKSHPEEALLSLKILDPACGSGHFLIAAVHRIADAVASARENGAEPSPESSRAALREVVGRCLYGIDLNPMAVELCKVSLWLESNTPGRPLGFLDHRIVCGNSLLGTTPRLLAQGIPDAAFKPLTGDDKKHVSALRKANRKERKQQAQGFLTLEWSPASDAAHLASAVHRIDTSADDTAEQVANKEAEYARLRASGPAVKAKLVADAWCAAFVAPKTPGDPPITDKTLRDLRARSHEQIVADVWSSRQATAHPEDRITDIAIILRLADQYGLTHLHLTFPDVFQVPEDAADALNEQHGWSGGFDVVIGNPPWDQIQYDPRETFAFSHPEIAEAPTMAKRNAMIRELETEEPSTYGRYQSDVRHLDGVKHFVHASGRYPLGSVGRLNTAPLFVELMWDSIGPQGQAGMIIPTGIATDSFTQSFFRAMIDRAALVSLYDFENAKPLFSGVHRSFKFCLLTLVGARCRIEASKFSFFAHEIADLNDYNRISNLAQDDFALINPNTKTCPIFRTSRDAQITKMIHRRVPPFLRDDDPKGNPWQVTFQLMFMMNTDSSLFRTREELQDKGYVLKGNHFILPDEPDSSNDRHLPLYEGKMATFFDHRAADVVKSLTASKRQNQPRYLSCDEKRDPTRYALPISWVNEHYVAERINPKSGWLLGYNDVTSATNERTMVCTALPRAAVGHSEPLIWAPCAPHLIIATLSSFALDYTARQKVGGNHMTYAHLKQLPVLPQELLRYHSSAIRNSVLELAYTAWDIEPFAVSLGSATTPFQWDDRRRALIRAELDGLMFHLYGINRRDADYIMDTFSIVRRKDEAEYDEFRTKRLTMDRYDAMTKAYGATHGTLANTPNGANPPLDQPALTTYSRRLAEALGVNYQTIVDPAPADPSQAHPASTRPLWASPNVRMQSQRENQDNAVS